MKQSITIGIMINFDRDGKDTGTEMVRVNGPLQGKLPAHPGSLPYQDFTICIAIIDI